MFEGNAAVSIVNFPTVNVHAPHPIAVRLSEACQIKNPKNKMIHVDLMVPRSRATAR